jgi:8-oxo-dGTP pyrophosphatase MutT (NUDIX family)
MFVIRLLFAFGHALRRLWWRVSRRRTLGVRIMLHRDGKVLLIRHRYGGPLMLPGGGVDARETVWAAARRELAEETGIADCGALRLAGVYLHLASGRPDYVVLFVGDLPETIAPYRPAPLSEVQSIHVEMADAGDGKLSAATRRRIAELLDGTPVSEWW